MPRPKGLKQNVTVKFRCSSELISVLKKVQSDNFYHKGIEVSKLYRWLLVEGALRATFNEELRKEIQALITNKKF